MTTGIDANSWDMGGGCWGRKYICTNALNGTYGDISILLDRGDISGLLRPDFDANLYVAMDDCWGARRSTQNETMVLVNGTYVPVWCGGILSSVSETLQNGEITTGTQPTCATLAADNIAKVLNGRCYGKYYDASKYAVECSGETPTLVILNGAEYNPSSSNGLTPSTANSLFGAMQTSAASQRAKYFKK